MFMKLNAETGLILDFQKVDASTGWAFIPRLYDRPSNKRDRTKFTFKNHKFEVKLSVHWKIDTLRQTSV